MTGLELLELERRVTKAVRRIRQYRKDAKRRSSTSRWERTRDISKARAEAYATALRLLGVDQ